MSGPSTQALFQLKSIFASQSWFLVPVVGSTQTTSHSHNIFSMAKPPLWATKSCLPLGPNFLVSVWVGSFVSLLSGHPVWSGQGFWAPVPSSTPSTKTTASMTNRLPENGPCTLSWLEVLSGTGSLVTFLQDWACLTGFAGLLPRILLSMCCLEQTLEWEWASLPLIGQWFAHLLIHWWYLYVPHLYFTMLSAYIGSFTVVVTNECRSCICSYFLGYCSNSLL